MDISKGIIGLNKGLIALSEFFNEFTMFLKNKCTSDRTCNITLIKLVVATKIRPDSLILSARLAGLGVSQSGFLFLTSVITDNSVGDSDLALFLVPINISDPVCDPVGDSNLSMLLNPGVTS